MENQSRLAATVLVLTVVGCMLAASVLYVALPDVTPEDITTDTITGGRGSIYLEATYNDFLSAGYQDGDQVMLKFEGKEPIYGLFCKNKDSVGYFEVYVSYDKKSDRMSLGQKFGGLDSSYTGAVKISYVKHLDRVENLDNYLDGKIDYTESKSDDTFCNFREVTVGDIKSNMLYRSVDPLGSNKDGRTAFADYYAGQVGIAHEINLCESASTIDKRIDDGTLVSTYCRSLYENGNVLFQQMSPSLFNNTAQFKVCLTYMIDNDGPFLIHCMEGKDRTGMYFILVEGLCGGTMEEITKDYMQTMVNFYNIVPESKEYYTVKEIMFDRIVYFIAHPDEFEDCNTINWDKVSISDVDINKACADYLLNEVGMTQSQLDALVAKLTN